MKIKILTVIGTRADALKLVPIIKELKKVDSFDSYVCSTGQHDEMLQQVLDVFEIKTDYHLDVMKDSKTLELLTANILLRFSKILEELNPDRIIIQGDTSTTFVASLAAFYKKIPVSHVEAGLRTDDIYAPFPEELNRRLTTSIADLHFAPTPLAANNLKKENISSNKIFITGNTIIDALFLAIKKLNLNEKLNQTLKEKFNFIDKNKKLILVTCHRRENFGARIKEICFALNEISKFDNVQIVFPVHLNPNVKKIVFANLSKNENIYLLEPQEYFPFVYLMQQSYLILTDSGGIQEEAPYLKKQVLVLRDKTERPEALKTGLVKVIGTNGENIIREVKHYLEKDFCNKNIIIKDFPFGNGKAASIIVNHLKEFYQLQNLEENRGAIKSKQKHLDEAVA